MLENLLKNKNVKSLTNNEQKNISGGNPLGQQIGCQWSAASQASADGWEYGTVDFDTAFQEYYNECMYY